MSVHSLVTNGLWAAPAMMLSAISIRMYQKKIIGEFPCFTAYTIEHVVRAVGLYVVLNFSRQSYTNYFYGYWAAEAIDVVLGIAVIYEIYSHVFRHHEALQRLGNVLFQWSAAMLFLAAVAMAAMTQGSDHDRLIAAILLAEQCFSFFRVGLLLLLFVFARTFGLTWRQYVFGIALGLAVYVSVDLAIVAMRGHLGTVANTTYAVIKSAAYNCTVVIWTVYFLQRQRSANLIRLFPSTDLDRWNEALAKILNR